jgi:secreted trypsin-like serine protease
MLVKLDQPVDDSPIIQINRDANVPSTDGEDLTVLGFGNTNADPSDVLLAQFLQKIVTGYVSFETCKVAEDPVNGGSYESMITEDWLCTIRSDPRVGNCVGDSGGPVIKEIDSSATNDILVGTVSG